MPEQSRKAADRPELRAVTGAVERSDDELIEAVLLGDRAVARELYRRLLPVIERTLYRLFGGRAPEHEDLVQSSFEQIIRSLATETFHRDCSLPSWASVIATRAGLGALRKRYREGRVRVHPTRADADALGNTGDLRPEVEARAELERVRRVLVTLSPQRAQVLFLHDVQGHTLAEIGALIDASYAAVQSALVRGRRQLMERLSEPRASEETP